MGCFDHGGDTFALDGDFLDFSVNLSPLGLPEGVKTALAPRAEDARYPDPYCRRLCAAIAAKKGLFPADILCGNGAGDLIFRLCLARRPKKTLLAVPCFSEYEKAARLAGSEIEYHVLKEAESFALGPDFLAAIGPDTDMIFLASPNNPNGLLISPALLDAVAARCEGVGAVLVVDECFLAFTEGLSARTLLDQYPKLVVLDAFTKSHAMAGLRLGFLMTKNHTLLEAAREAGPCWSVSAPAQRAGLAALEEGDYIARMRELSRRERLWLEEALKELGLKVYPGDANFLLFFCEKELSGPMQARGILLRNCENYPGLGPGFWRIGVRERRDNETLIRHLREVLYG